MIPIDCTESHSVTRLIGTPPGTHNFSFLMNFFLSGSIAFEQGALLTEAIRRQPFAVVLFDEIEKVHPHIWNTLLQLFNL
jgi:ATP-dependent Clp protease ATP-binding subunit ClpC